MRQFFRSLPPILLCCLWLAVLSGCMEGHVEKGLTSLRLGDYGMAVEFFGAELRHNPQSYEARLGLGKAYLQQAAALGGDTVSWRLALVNLEAARTLRPGVEIVPLIGEGWSAYARVLLSRGDTLAGLAALARAIEYSPADPAPLNAAGILYYTMGHNDKAEVLFRQALARDSGAVATHFNLGMLALQRDDFAAAHASLLQALKRAPGDGDILYWFALSEKKLREAGQP